MTAPNLPGERPTARALLPVPLLTAVLAALAVAGAVARAPESVRVPLALGAGAGALLLTAAVAVAAHATQNARIARRRLEAVTLDAGRLLQDRARQSAEFDQERVQLTQELTQERARHAAELTRERARLTAELEEERARLTAANARLTERARRAEQERSTALSATANAAGRMQALATGMLADLRAMEERHDDEDVLADLLHLDHRTAQAGRLADSVAVLTGARSGRRWARPIAMESILRGAMGRISGYRRVRVHSACEAAVAGHAAEGVMHALAELLDNAANFSPPTAEVHVYVEEVPAGVIVSVEDSGLVMGELQLRRAERAVSGDDAELGGLTGTRLGLAVVGRLSRKYGLTVSFRPSARGGTGVLMLVPQDILVPEQLAPRPQGALTLPQAAVEGTEAGATTAVRADSAWAGPSPAPDPVPTHESPGHSAAILPDDLPTDRSEGSSEGLPDGLPKRRRGRALAAAEREQRERVRARAAETARTARTAGTARTTEAIGTSGSTSAFGALGAGEPTSHAGPADDTPARAVRFSSFRQAVRGTSTLTDQSDPATPAYAETPEPSTQAPPAHTHPTPEGDPTS
ncbi:signal transduction histidine kinase [Streptomyces sp. TLI_55]|uniref:sensor histidine kinase n=1 Tax=Streptomyces sp. TLI_55 TaxID=1938861 RepID=UPI000BD3E15B|nr:ATP-binding protein [Streptomyces sp. TLI_55]SNX62021.1 signal transduction histidine kinase [Streptomyces sp. TLI_55]